MKKILKYLFVSTVFSLSALQATGYPAESVNSISEKQVDMMELGQVLSDESLGAETGRQDIIIGDMDVQLTDVKNNAQMEGNILSATNSTFSNGANSIGQGAFANSTGFVTVIQNSGNQVLIKNDTVLNLFIK